MESFEETLMEHHSRLVRWCAALSGDASAADDLAQETIITAWRIRHKLTDASGMTYWLYAIARNICQRSRRHAAQSGAVAVEDLIVDGVNLEAEFEKHELAVLLDSAMAWLPPDTRAVTAARYLHEQPLEEIAASLAISQNALAVRLHRGKAALRDALKTHLRAQAEAYGLASAGDDWQVTRLWCYGCGQHHLSAKFDAERGALSLRCDGCNRTLEEANGAQRIIGTVRGLKSVLNRLFAWSSQQFVAGGGVRCACCGEGIPVRMAQYPSLRGTEWALDASCHRCGSIRRESLYGQASHSAAGRQFWKTHERIQMLPQRTCEVDGRAAIVTTLQSIRTSHSLHVISALADGRILRVE